MARNGPFLAHAKCDADGQLLQADEPLAGLQLRCGGDIPGLIAIPELLALVRKAGRFGLPLAQPIHAQDGAELITAWADVRPDPNTGSPDTGKSPGSAGFLIGIANWQSSPIQPEDLEVNAARRAVIDRQLAEISIRLDPRQRLLAVESTAPELRELISRMRDNIGSMWTEFVEIRGNNHRQPLHWRLLDGAMVELPGSDRTWRAGLVPLGAPDPGSAGFELHLVAEQPPAEQQHNPDVPPRHTAAIGREVAPVLRQPIARIIANAETIRTRLAGPLTEKYSNYAADIAAAGQHLLSLLDDLADLEIVEADDFSTSPDQIDLADVARRAAGILSVRAQEKAIIIDLPAHDEAVRATGEFRRVLQILLNLLGNAIRYAPEESQIWIRTELSGSTVSITVADQGKGLSTAQQALIFNKFERLGRSGDGGSGLGLYISRRLARAMQGDLEVESAPGQGARFILSLPGAE